MWRFLIGIVTLTAIRPLLLISRIPSIVLVDGRGRIVDADSPSLLLTRASIGGLQSRLGFGSKGISTSE